MASLLAFEEESGSGPRPWALPWEALCGHSRRGRLPAAPQLRRPCRRPRPPPLSAGEGGRQRGWRQRQGRRRRRQRCRRSQRWLPRHRGAAARVAPAAPRPDALPASHWCRAATGGALMKPPLPRRRVSARSLGAARGAAEPPRALAGGGRIARRRGAAQVHSARYHTRRALLGRRDGDIRAGRARGGGRVFSWCEGCDSGRKRVRGVRGVIGKRCALGPFHAARGQAMILV